MLILLSGKVLCVHSWPEAIKDQRLVPQKKAENSFIKATVHSLGEGGQVLQGAAGPQVVWGLDMYWVFLGWEDL